MVVEIFGEYVVPCYWALSTLANLKYFHYLAPEATLQRQARHSPAGSGTHDLSSTTVTAGKEPAIDLETRRTLGIDLNVDDFIEKLDGWMSTYPVAE
jgi:hypothetical protein